ncbi:delta 1-pyrroline-5-carboxylate reductase [Cystobasidiomycetes sp. EMM_F5]
MPETGAAAASSSSSLQNGHPSGSALDRLNQENGAASPSPSSSQIFNADIESLPDAYIATVNREESARKLAKTFKAMPGGAEVKVQAGSNVQAAEKADVVLLWYGLKALSQKPPNNSVRLVVNLRWLRAS